MTATATITSVALTFSDNTEIRKALAIIKSAEAMMKDANKLISQLEKAVKEKTPNAEGEIDLILNGETMGKVVISTRFTLDQAKFLQDFPDAKETYGKTTFAKSVKL